MKILSTLLILSIYSGITIAQETGHFTDPRDGKTYKTVKIGNQVWMAENLAFKADSGCWIYGKDTVNLIKYGYLYDYKTTANICPTGWHLPSKEEFETLLNNAGGEFRPAYNMLKQNGNTGFSALFSGYRHDSGSFGNIGVEAWFWSSTPGSIENAWSLLVTSNGSFAVTYYLSRSYGFSVRCLKND